MKRFPHIGRMLAAAFVVALVLAGTMSTGVHAAKNGSPGASQANDMINACFAQGGDASVGQSDGETTVLCTFPDGRWEACTWSAGGMKCNRGTHATISRVSELIIVNGLPTVQLQTSGSGGSVQVKVTPDTRSR